MTEYEHKSVKKVYQKKGFKWTGIKKDWHWLDFRWNLTYYCFEFIKSVQCCFHWSERIDERERNRHDDAFTVQCWVHISTKIELNSIFVEMEYESEMHNS